MVHHVNILFGGVIKLLFRVRISYRFLSWFMLVVLPEVFDVGLVFGLDDSCSGHFAVVLDDPFAGVDCGRCPPLPGWFDTVDICGAHEAWLLKVHLVISKIHYFE